MFSVIPWHGIRTRTRIPVLHLVIFAIIFLTGLHPGDEGGGVGVRAQNGPTNWTTVPFNPPALPLTVRSPYLNTWLRQGNNPESLNNAWPGFWDAAGVLGWYSSVVVDGTAYKLMADTNVPVIEIANQTAIEFTATRTSFLFSTGPMQINMSFVSPIEPTDLVRQSLPFSYITMSARATDDNTHNIRMFINTNGELITGDASLPAEWAGENDDQYIVLSMQLQQQRRFSEINNHAQDGIEYLAFKKISGTSASWAITENNANHALAANASGTLGNQADTNFRAVNDNWPTLGVAVDWTSIRETQEPAVWALGLVRSPSIQYRTSDGVVEERYPYFMSAYSDGTAAAKAFLDDYTRAETATAKFDARLVSAGQQYSSEYADLLVLSARQIMGSMDITITRSGSGGWDTSDVKVFMKNLGGIGSDSSGSTLSINTVDTLYAAFPTLLYLFPELAGYLLSPLLEFQDSSAYTLSYAARNIGSAYPNATADEINYSHDYGVEESANMLIMTLAYSQRSGKGTFISRHYMLLRKWAEYLENNALTPINQKSPDFVTGSVSSSTNQTNTAIKGILGIASMAKMADIAGVNGDRDRFSNTASSFASQWVKNALASDNTHISFFYGQSGTNGLIYNLFADKLLQLNLVPGSVYDVVTSFYGTMAGQASYGIPLNGDDSDRTTTHGMMLAASTVTNATVRNNMISQLHGFATSSRNDVPFASVYNPSTGTAQSGSGAGFNSPAAGALFALLALNTTIQPSIRLPSEGSTIPGSESSSGSINAGTIAGGVVSAISGILIVLGLYFYMKRRRRLREEFEKRTMAIPILPTEFGSGGTSAVDSIENRQDQKGTLDDSKSPPLSTSNPDAAVRTDDTLGNTFRTGPSPTVQPSNNLASVLHDRAYISQEITSLRRELEMLRQDVVIGNEPPPSYAGSSSG